MTTSHTPPGSQVRRNGTGLAPTPFPREPEQKPEQEQEQEPQAQEPAEDLGEVESSEAHTAEETPTDGAPQPTAPSEAPAPRPELVDEGGRLTRLALLRLARTAVALVVLGLLVGVVAVLVLPRTYAARAEVLYPISSQQAEPTGFLREDRNLTTQIMVLQSRSLLAPIATANGMSVEDLTKSVTATVAEGSEILQLEVRDHSRERGVVLSDQIVRAYLETARDDDRDQVRSYLVGQLSEVRAQLDRARDPRQSLEVRLAAQSLAAREQSLAQQLDQLTLLQLSVPRPSVVVPPYSAADPVSPGFLTAGATGALAGAVAAAVVAAVLRWMWTRRAARP